MADFIPENEKSNSEPESPRGKSFDVIFFSSSDDREAKSVDRRAILAQPGNPSHSILATLSKHSPAASSRVWLMSSNS